MFNKRNGRYAETKPNKERTVISYEDMPLEDYEQERTNISPKAVKKIIIAVAIALVAGLLVLAFANRDKLSPENLSMWWSYEVLPMLQIPRSSLSTPRARRSRTSSFVTQSLL
nr:hypothetical protein [uncultured Ruminococcus sp.]